KSRVSTLDFSKGPKSKKQNNITHKLPPKIHSSSTNQGFQPLIFRMPQSKKQTQKAPYFTTTNLPHLQIKNIPPYKKNHPIIPIFQIINHIHIDTGVIGHF
ncbi:MAG: hypothetical protein WAT16_07345, partial [Saprospiraceae bacterium]